MVYTQSVLLMLLFKCEHALEKNHQRNRLCVSLITLSLIFILLFLYIDYSIYKTITYYIYIYIYIHICMYIYGIHHWRILWSRYKKLIWVGFEPTTAEFRSEALADWAIMPWLQLALRAYFVDNIYI